MGEPAPGKLPPATLPVRLAADVRLVDGGRLLIGGTPFRLLRLSAAGAQVVGAWRGQAAPVGPSAGARALARRMIDAGMLEVFPPPIPTDVGVSVVVPTRDRTSALARCLASIRATVPDVSILVVDDGSIDSAAVASVATDHDATVVRHTENLGPGAARNTGLAHTTSAFVAFVDSDVVVGPDPAWLRRLAAHFDDPCVGAVAPRVLGLAPPSTWIAGYEARHSSLDMGARAGLAAPRRPLSYVPATTLVVRRAAAGAGFDPSLRVGEDVDFVWRMVAAGWLTRYEPAASVRHEHRVTLGAFIARRRDYARSIAPLATRHPSSLPALRADWATASALLLLGLRRPRTALALFVFRAVRLRGELRGHVARPWQSAARLAARNTGISALGLSHAVRRVWSPLVFLIATRRPRALWLLAAASVTRLLSGAGPRRPADQALDHVDDLIAAIGTWEGCIRHRTLRPLLPSRTRGARVSASPR